MNAVLKYPGSKWNLASWIINYFPEHHSYLEPFFGTYPVWTRYTCSYKYILKIEHKAHIATYDIYDV